MIEWSPEKQKSRKEVRKGPAKLPMRGCCWQVKGQEKVVVDGCSFVVP
jgi:hypothetical protein